MICCTISKTFKTMSILTEQQQYIMNLLQNGKNVFATGPAGSGKSFLIGHILQQFPIDSTQVCSMTGVSTVLLNTDIPKGKAKTLHSWSGIGLCNSSRTRIIEKILRNRKCVANWLKTKLLIIDEVSMMSKYVLETIEEIGRRIRRNQLPFGGMQVIFTGDMFQLPPIGGSGEDDGKFCFESTLWSDLFKDTSIELTRVFRQQDDEFISILNDVRMGQCSEESVKLLRSRVGLKPPSDAVMTKLFPTRFNVSQINTLEYEKLLQEEFVFPPIIQTNIVKHIDDGRPFDAIDAAQCLAATPDIIEKEILMFSSGLSCYDTLKLKIGTIVMCMVNLDVEKGIVNGSQGRIKEFHLGFPVVEFINGYICKINYYFWQSNNLPCIAIGLIPLVLSWATTIHKSQGMTLSRAEMNLGNQVFECGQIYVALSRVKSLEGLYLTEFNPYKIKANPRVVQFYHSLRNHALVSK